ncbi:hypothetical protein FMUND_11463 [Fusarium mundagurra]|uniref:Uncharacterized protein n=1 Tax=Fusarium mundagurra TaxID=1567541 RepID=A0A8H6D7P3_9HYPO|nr:hypothetical protein FMUND_11463 [Fusarium mundagurra]
MVNALGFTGSQDLAAAPAPETSGLDALHDNGLSSSQPLHYSERGEFRIKPRPEMRAQSERDFRVMLERGSFSERPDACMEVAEVESDKRGGGLTIGGIIGAVLGSIVTSTSIHVDDVDPVQSSDKDATSAGTSLPSAHTVRSIAPIALTQAFNNIWIAYIHGVIKRANLMSLFSSAADEQCFDGTDSKHAFWATHDFDNDIPDPPTNTAIDNRFEM